MTPPPPSPEADAIRECLCLQRSMERASSEMTDKRNSLDRIDADLRQADADLERQRAALNTSDPQAVAQFRQRLEQRDALFKRSTGPIVNDVTTSVQRYNDRVGAYNQQCANRPFNSILQAQIQATLSCPPE
jgi:septal ring factor EnvC (AmiA/AmiB activator)